MTPLNTSPTPSTPGHWVVTKFGGPSVLQWQTDTTIPSPAPGHALVRILIAGISGADNIMRAGGYTRVPQTRQPGFTPGYDLVGIVEAVNGAEDEAIDETQSPPVRPGDLIATISVVGAYATHALVRLDECLPLQVNDDLLKIAALPLNYMTALGMLTLSKFPLTSTTSSILIGSVAGGVGTALAQLTHLLFPRVKIFGTCSPSKFPFVESLEVTPVDRNTPPSHLPSKIRGLNGDRGVDVAYEATGHPETMTAFLSATEPESGKLVAIGFMANVSPDGSGTSSETFDPVAFCATRPDRMAFFSVTNMYWRGRRDRFRKDFEDVLLKAVRAERLDPLVGGMYRLGDAVRINEMLAGGEGVQGKLAMVVDEEMWRRYGGQR